MAKDMTVLVSWNEQETSSKQKKSIPQEKMDILLALALIRNLYIKGMVSAKVMTAIEKEVEKRVALFE